MANYEYMKEYESHGKRPEGLPLDCQIQWMPCDDESHWCPAKSHTSVGKLYWQGSECSPVGKFRIVDERWKPVALPDIGEEMRYDQETVTVIAHDEKLPQVAVRHSDGQLSVLATAWLKPLRTLRDVEIDNAIEYARESAGGITAKIKRAVTGLYDDHQWRPAETLLNDFAAYLSEHCDLSVANQVSPFLRERTTAGSKS